MLKPPIPYIEVRFETSPECENLGMSGPNEPFSSPPLVLPTPAHVVEPLAEQPAENNEKLVRAFRDAIETLEFALSQMYNAFTHMNDGANTRAQLIDEAADSSNWRTAAQDFSDATDAFSLASDFAGELVTGFQHLLQLIGSQNDEGRDASLRARVQKLEKLVKALQDEDYEGGIFENAQNIDGVATINDLHFKKCLLHQKQNQEQFALLRDEIVSLKKALEDLRTQPH